MLERYKELVTEFESLTKKYNRLRPRTGSEGLKLKSKIITIETELAKLRSEFLFRSNRRKLDV